MTYENAHPAVILLLNAAPATDNKFIKRWFQKSRFSACEADDIFHAIEEITDFTTPYRPDVILLEVASVIDDYEMVKKMSETLAGACAPQIFAFSESGGIINDGQCFEGNLAQIEARLNTMIPVYGEMRRTLAA